MYEEITDLRVLRDMRRLEAVGEMVGHKFEVKKRKGSYSVWMDDNRTIALASFLTPVELGRYIDGMRDMFLMLKQRR